MGEINLSSNETGSFYEGVISQMELSAEDLLGVSPPMNVKLENPASVIDFL